MNRLCMDHVREIRAGKDLLPNPCRPVRMQAAGWSRANETLTGFAWRKALGRRAIWRRAAITGMVTAVLCGAAGAVQPWALGAMALGLTLLTQFWQHVDDRRDVARSSLN